MRLFDYLKANLPASSAVKLSLWVCAALIIVQGALLIPMLWSNEQQLLKSLSEREQANIQQSLNSYPALRLENIRLNDTLLGLRVYNESSSKSSATAVAFNQLSARGEVSELTEDDLAASDKIERIGDQIETHWTLQFHGQPVFAKARLNASEVVASKKRIAWIQLGYGLLAGLIGGFIAFLTAVRFFVRPLELILNAIRSNREEGAGDIPEPIELSESNDLNRIVDEFNGIVEEQRKGARQVKVKQQYLEYAAHHDPLTHLSNRLMFEDRLKQTVKTAVAEDEQFCVFLVDLDNFKFFNDQYGHLIGDKMVVEVGSRLKTMMRDIDLVARLDGDEFVVIQKDIVDKASAEEIAERVMSIVTAPFEYRGFTLKAAVSVGISHFPDDVHADQDEEMLTEEIVNNAAVALQEAKTNGKNQYQLFNESMRSRLTARIRLEQDLKTALQDEQFEVYYQPKINIATRQVTGAEALVRWNHPTDGRISPEIFVPVAEEAGMIIEIGEWILRTACRQTHMLQQIGFGGLNIAVNISAVQFTDGNLLPMVSKALKDSNLEPELLELEITESAVMHDPEEVIHSLHELSRFGMRLAIDDFGTGYSSLAYLKRFPVNTLKIDRAFITDISSDSDDVAIVEAVLGLGNHFNMKVVAEGVEDEDQLEFLSKQGCDLAQGYYISQPMNMQSYIKWLEQWPHGIQGNLTGIAAENVAKIASGTADPADLNQSGAAGSDDQDDQSEFRKAS